MVFLINPLEQIGVSGTGRLIKETAYPHLGDNGEQHYLAVRLSFAAENRPYTNFEGINEVNLPITREKYESLLSELKDDKNKGMIQLKGNLEFFLK